MPIEFFKQEEETVSLDFLPDVLEENPKINGKTFDVFSFKKAKSGKGYMLYTSDFICWFFKKEKVLQQALEALDFYCKTGAGFQFVVQVDKTLKSKFSLGIDTDREVKYIPLENTSYRLGDQKNMEATLKESKAVNPFLVSKSTPSLHPLNTVPPNNGDLTPPTTLLGEKGRGTKK